MNKLESCIIHPTACVDTQAVLGIGVQIDAYAVIGPHVVIGAHTRVYPHVVIDGYTVIGEQCAIYPSASIGLPPQDMKFNGEKTIVRIGDHTTIREYVTINAATGEGSETTIGSHCLLMAYAHVAHNCSVGNYVIMANAGTLAGHVSVYDYAIIGGLSAVHQFCRIGALAIIGGCSKVVKDILPYSMADGHPAVIYGLNSIGLKRQHYSLENIRQIKAVYKFLYHSNIGISKAAQRLTNEFNVTPEVQMIQDFVLSSQRGISRHLYNQYTDGATQGCV